MGLDMVEFVMAVEDAFDVAIPDEDAACLRTPRDVIDFVTGLLPTAATSSCLTQQAFYHVRRATAAACGIERATVRPEARLADVFGSDESPAWHAVRADLNATHWPRIGRDRWLRDAFEPRLETFGELATFVVERCPTSVKRQRQGWTRTEVADVVNRLIRSHLGVTRYHEDSSFIDDMGVD